MKSFINNLNQDALAKLASTLTKATFSAAIIWTHSKFFYCADGSAVDFAQLDDVYRLRLMNESVSITINLTKTEFIALSAICESRSESVRNYSKGE